ncbi:hypothetical protein MHH33_12625 [Paenisporosarcina sp. FSL H8-0542]|uniref:hypothetical protein n=1 Tax=Paenisporosarcina sp. FSL H8-0542 TaxID=2921401 RepID=UPI003159AE67
MIETDYLKLISSFIKGEMNFEKYFSERGLTPSGKLTEVKHLLNANPLIFDHFLSKLTIGVRCLVMKTVFDLDDRELIEMSEIYNSKTTISKFIRSNFTNESQDSTIKNPQFKIELLYDLAIILDIPFRYLANPDTLFDYIDSFDEYDRNNIQRVSFKELIEDAANKSKVMVGDQRKIYGVKVKQDDFLLLGEGILNTRVDIRARYFTIEIHIKNDANLKYPVFLKLQRLINARSRIYIREAFLRLNKKLIFLITIDDSYIPDITYLNNDLLADNIFSLDIIMAKGREKG